ncbi:MAG: Hpt domain-containing protein [Kiritimatiellae bacterium]|nr:Hpt domain-containing protein [Kiritimatiellia bacterium]MDD4737007.1 Hpt domain-containing protein [Kiritimatiellia bacterium]
MQDVVKQDEKGAVDFAWLTQNVGGNNELVRRLLSMFEDVMKDTLEKLDQALHSSDFDGLSRAAHGLKGTAATMGAGHVSSLSAALNESAKTGDTEELEKQMEQLVSACGTARIEIEQFLES